MKTLKKQTFFHHRFPSHVLYERKFSSTPMMMNAPHAGLVSNERNAQYQSIV